MDKHTMQALQDVSAHKEAIIHKVRQQIQQEPYPSKPKWTYRAVTIMMTCSILFFIAWQAAKPSNQLTTQVMNEEENLLLRICFKQKWKEQIQHTVSFSR